MEIFKLRIFWSSGTSPHVILLVVYFLVFFFNFLDDSSSSSSVNCSVLISKLSDSRTYSIGGYILGKHPSVSANLLVGNYASAKFYNRALESFEIQQNYDAMRGRYS